MRKKILVSLICTGVLALGIVWFVYRLTPDHSGSRQACRQLHFKNSFANIWRFSPDVRPVAEERTERFLGKPSEDNPEKRRMRLKCRGGERAVEFGNSPWVDWSNYWGTRGVESLPEERWPVSWWPDRWSIPKSVGLKMALVDLEYQRMELIKFNLFDNLTWKSYLRDNGTLLELWPEMQLPEDHPRRDVLQEIDGRSVCWGDSIRYRTLSGVCNDIENPMMGSSGMVLARNVQFESTFPDEPRNEILVKRHGDRIGLMRPDPQLVSRKLLARPLSVESCDAGRGRLRNGVPAAGPLEQYSADADCPYQAASSMNVLAAFWIQFMTHDWFSHLEAGRNATDLMDVGCADEEAQAMGCRPDEKMNPSLVETAGEPGTFRRDGRDFMERSPKTFRNTVTAWWDASQIYGYDEASRQRVIRDPRHTAKLLMPQRGNHGGIGEEQGYLPLLGNCSDTAGPDAEPADCRVENPAWAGQEATAFPDNFTIGLSFLHNVFAREHNLFVDHFRSQPAATDSGLRDPADSGRVIRYGDVSDDLLFEVARLVVAAEIAKIHTIEWTTQLLYNEPLYKAMNANWNGLVDKEKHKFLSRLLAKITDASKKSGDPKLAHQLYSVFASGAGIFGLGSNDSDWQLTPEYVNQGTNHFGSPFNFPEEFVTVYRLHPLLPDLAEYRDWREPDEIRAKVPFVTTFRSGSATAMTAGGLANWGVSLGRQRLGALTLGNHPAFLQNLQLEHLEQPIDVVALDLIRDRERGVPRYNEFRRQYGLRQITRFDDFADARLKDSNLSAHEKQLEMVQALREVYGQHECDAAKVITESQLNPDGTPITDCLGQPDGTLVDNVEDLDTVVGWLAEYRRPHGFAISETQFVVFILNASRRLFSDRFFTSSFRPEFYSYLGHDWVNFNGPCESDRMHSDGRCESQPMTLSNGHEEPVSPFKRVLLRTVPELKPELEGVVNAFDPWSRDRGEYYSLAWEPRAERQNDVSFP